EIFADSPDTIHQTVFYHWNAITADPDDNKFFDAAVAANADYLVTNDSHFNEAKNISFPKLSIISAAAFLDLLSSLPKT
ncbi:MAG TPA: PIN domain-containing protein, partial [Flavisolibacter sp.]|nr:PIN domain-containing protein [Flavisolibacter sp.]